MSLKAFWLTDKVRRAAAEACGDTVDDAEIRQSFRACRGLTSDAVRQRLSICEGRLLVYSVHGSCSGYGGRDGLEMIFTWIDEFRVALAARGEPLHKTPTSPWYQERLDEIIKEIADAERKEKEEMRRRNDDLENRRLP